MRNASHTFCSVSFMKVTPPRCITPRVSFVQYSNCLWHKHSSSDAIRLFFYKDPARRSARVRLHAWFFRNSAVRQSRVSFAQQKIQVSTQIRQTDRCAFLAARFNCLSIKDIDPVCVYCRCFSSVPMRYKLSIYPPSWRKSDQTHRQFSAQTIFFNGRQMYSRLLYYAHVTFSTVFSVLSY